jgi:DinB superfamily
MREQAEELANTFERESNEVIALAETCSDEQWTTLCPDEAWPVGMVLMHIALSWKVALHWVQMATSGTPDTITMEFINENNARLALAGLPARSDVLATLRANAEDALRGIRRLSSAELDTSSTFTVADGRALTARQVIRYILLRHLREHFGHVCAALGVKKE